MAGRILIVDQDYSQREFLRNLLEKRGYRVVLMEDGYQVGDVLKDESFGIIFLDSKSGGIKDKSLFTQIKRSCPDCHIILISSKRGDGFIKEAMEFGVFGCVDKPFKEEEVLGMVRLISPIRD